MVDCPSKSFNSAKTEDEIDEVIEEFECDPDEIVKRQFDIDPDVLDELAGLLL